MLLTLRGQLAYGVVRVYGCSFGASPVPRQSATDKLCHSLCLYWKHNECNYALAPQDTSKMPGRLNASQ